MGAVQLQYDEISSLDSNKQTNKCRNQHSKIIWRKKIKEQANPAWLFNRWDKQNVSNVYIKWAFMATRLRIL